MASQITPFPIRSSTWVSDVRRALLAWGREHPQDYPWRAAGVPRWQALVAEFLLLRTRASQVVPVFENLQSEFPDPRSFGVASEERLRRLMSPLGLQWRVPLLVKLARAIGASDGNVPVTVDDLRQLPGVGEYVAGATAALHGGERAAIVDSNIVRWLCRLVGAPYDGETRRKRWLRDFADELTPEIGFREYGYAALDLSMTVCRPRQPECGNCPLAAFCATGGERVPIAPGKVVRANQRASSGI